MTSITASRVETAAPEFWDSIYTKTSYSRELSEGVKQAVQDAVAFFGDIRGKTVIDVGCGAGATTLLLAQLGANVIALDTSEVALGALADRCRQLGLDNVKPALSGALAIDNAGPCDFAFGSMILHHIEPFGDFCAALKRALKPGGKAFFFENNAASDLLIWFRTHVVGKLWVPKYGDPYEFPLTPAEIRLLGRHFKVHTDYPSMLFLELVATYLLRGRGEKLFRSFDAWLYRHRIGLKYSYSQYVYIENA
jgi:2-polyprenyl-3-methyl-5-hydroxy-6-metoxy-1,4-benzoquinol methylase